MAAHAGAIALITGVSGQDGSYLAELLAAQGMQVYGLVRRKADTSNWRIQALLDSGRLSVIPGDVTDGGAVMRIMSQLRPRFVFNLAAQSFVHYSWDVPLATAEATGLGVLNVLEAVRQVRTDATGQAIRFYQASSSEMFGNAASEPQSENTPFHPRSPYGVAKVFGHHITVNYRESYELFAVSGILFNHESERRGLAFVTRKVTMAVALIKRGLQDKVALGNLDARRDWGYAPDYVRAMQLMLEQDEPRDFVIATGVSNTVRELCEAAFGEAGLDWQKHVEVDPAFMRPAELHILRGDSGMAQAMLGWEPEVSFGEMIRRMVAADIDRVDSGRHWEV
ncbi:GDP-mannose 4,6-dehydratase [bacterium]|nr:GDP-mannose 4,6-dehydratase [bacterium]